jgi:hypothetical protein
MDRWQLKDILQCKGFTQEQFDCINTVICKQIEETMDDYIDDLRHSNEMIKEENELLHINEVRWADAIRDLRERVDKLEKQNMAVEIIEKFQVANPDLSEIIKRIADIEKRLELFCI